MNFLSPKELTAQYAAAGAAKTKKSAAELLVLSMLAGALIALGAVASNTATFGISNVGLSRTLCGLLFPFGLCMVIVSGAELFTGNCLITISVLDRRCSVGGMLRNWVIVYLGNFAGSLLVAAGCAYFGQFNYGGGALAVATIKTAVAKCGLSFSSGIVLGILCNFLVCMAVLMSTSSKDAPGRLMGAYLPIAFFVISGFEHCVANMYYVPAGLMAAANPQYAALAVEAGVDLSNLTVSSFLMGNLLPVTLGNILGGCLLGLLMWFSYLRKEQA